MEVRCHFAVGRKRKVRGVYVASRCCDMPLRLDCPFPRQVAQKISGIFLEHIYPASPTRVGLLLTALGLVRNGGHAVLLILWKAACLDLWADNSLAQRQFSSPWLVQMEIGEHSTPSLECIHNLFPAYELMLFWRNSGKLIMIFIINSLA